MDISSFFKKPNVPQQYDGSTLAPIHAILERIAATSKRTEKERIIQESLEVPNFRKVVQYALDPFRMYGVSLLHTYSQSHQDARRQATGKYTVRTVTNLFAKLDDLAASGGTSNHDKWELSFLAAFDTDSMKVVNRIIKKDLRCGAGIRTFKKHMPELPLHEVMLCESDYPKFQALCGEASNVFTSVKLDGVRTWAVCPLPDPQNGLFRYVSRNGMEYGNFECFTESLRQIAANINANYGNKLSRLVLDGEAIARDRNFDSFCGRARSKQAVDTSNFVLHLFDFVAEDETGQLIPATTADRLFMLTTAITECAARLQDNVGIHPFAVLSSWESVPDLLAQALAAGEEGLVLKQANAPYSFGRSRAWCKIKNRTFTENTMDLPVVGKVEGTGAFEGLLGALVVENEEGTQIKVGSGYTVEQRAAYWEVPPKMIEVAYQDITKEGSLRFPIFIKARDDKWEPEDTTNAPV